MAIGVRDWGSMLKSSWKCEFEMCEESGIGVGDKGNVGAAKERVYKELHYQQTMEKEGTRVLVNSDLKQSAML